MGRCTGTLLLLGLCVCAVPRAAHADGAIGVKVYPDSVRFDLEDGAYLSARRTNAPRDPALVELALPVHFRAVRDEVVAFQLLLEGPDQTVSATVTGADAERVGVTVFRAAGMPIVRPSSAGMIYSTGAGTYPDILIPTTTVALAKGRALVWVDAWVRPTAPSGVTRFTLAVGPHRVPVEIDVIDAQLPDKDAARLGTVNFASYLERYHRDPKIELAWMQMAHAHRVGVEFRVARPRRLADGTEDWPEYVRHVGKYFDGTAFSAAHGYDGPRAGEPVVRFLLPVIDWWPSPATPSKFPSDPEAWKRAFMKFDELAQREGWLEKANGTDFILFINTLDEPKRAAQFHSIAAYGPLLKSTSLSAALRRRMFFRVDGPFGESKDGWSDEKIVDVIGDVTDVWNVHSAPHTVPWTLLQSRDERIMFYASNTGGEPSIPPVVVDSPIVALRAWGWIVSRYGLSGALNWEVDAEPGCVKNPGCASNGQLNLDANLIYRGEEVGERFDQPIASARLKLLRRGAQDAALLALLAEHDPETAAAIARAVIPNALGDGVPDEGFGAWPVDPRTYVRARDAILDRLGRGRADPIPIDTIRTDKPSVFAGKAKAILFRVGVALAGILFWVVVMVVRKRRRG